MAKKRFKKILKAALPYIIALIAGVILWAICTPYAKAHREDPSLVGGEACLPALTVLAVALIKNLPREIRELNRLTNETERAKDSLKAAEEAIKKEAENAGND